MRTQLSSTLVLALLAGVFVGCSCERRDEGRGKRDEGREKSDTVREDGVGADGGVPAASAVEAPALEEAAKESISPAYGIEKFLLLVPGGPLIVEVRLSIAGQPHTTALDALVDEVLRVGDADGDGRTEWQEILASPRFKYGQYGNLPLDRENSARQLVERYDTDRDGRADRDELPRFLTRNAGSSRPFSLRGTTEWRDYNRQASPTWRALDADGDGRLSAQELAGAAARLRGRDVDDDEILLPGDFVAGTPRELGEMPRRRLRGVDDARLLGAHANWEAIRLALADVYALGGPLRPESFPDQPQLFAWLDENGDGRLSLAEYERLDQAPADVIVALSFPETGQAAEPSSADAAEQAGEASPSVESAPQPASLSVEVSPALRDRGAELQAAGGGWRLRWPRIALDFALNDQAAAQDDAVQARQALEMFDADKKNGYLEASELPAAGQAFVGPLEAMDADGDGKAFAGEIAAFLAQRQAALRAQVHAKAADREDAVFAALDTNADERLSGREIAAAGERLASFDRDGDGQVAADELPGSLRIVLARGNLENADALFQPPPPAPAAPVAAPRWFTQMDANGDGGLSPREFLGTPEQFQSLDKSGDGFVTPNELPLP